MSSRFNIEEEEMEQHLWEFNPENSTHYYIKVASMTISGINIFGWVRFDEKNNVYLAGFPSSPSLNEDIRIGPFDSLSQAKKAVMENNPIPHGNFY